MRIGPFSIGRYKFGPIFIFRNTFKRGFLNAVQNVHKRVPFRPENRVVVLCYHSIHPTMRWSTASAEQFEEHLAWLTENCKCVPFSEVLDSAKAGTNDRPVVSVTFDDGYIDNHTTALPLLDKYKVPATFFILAGLVEEDPEVIARMRSLLRATYEDIRPMSWSQIGELKAAGMHIGGHTYSHPNLALKDAQTVTDELRRAKELIEDRIGAEVTSMAYPFGKPRRHFTPEVAEIARSVGYTHAGSITHRKVRASDSAFMVPRFDQLRDPVELIKAKVEGAFDLVGIGQEKVPMWAARMISPEDFKY